MFTQSQTAGCHQNFKSVDSSHEYRYHALATLKTVAAGWTMRVIATRPF
jgi:hypothetical protein